MQVDCVIYKNEKNQVGDLFAQLLVFVGYRISSLIGKRKVKVEKVVE
jgi:hypothetical protein